MTHLVLLAKPEKQGKCRKVFFSRTQKNDESKILNLHRVDYVCHQRNAPTLLSLLFKQLK